MRKPLIIIGAGEHTTVLLDILLTQKRNVVALTSINEDRKELFGIPIIKDEDVFNKYKSNEVLLINGIGSVGSTKTREKIFLMFKQKGFIFDTVIHQSSIVSKRAIIGEGVQILAGAIVNTGAIIKDNTIINTKVSVDHDCIIGSHVHIAPGCTLSGCISIGNGTHIGTGSCIIQGISIGQNTLIGAGSVVINDIASNSKAFGNPAKVRN